jgi:hypothetical protein
VIFNTGDITLADLGAGYAVSNTFGGLRVHSTGAISVGSTVTAGRAVRLFADTDLNINADVMAHTVASTPFTVTELIADANGDGTGSITQLSGTTINTNSNDLVIGVECGPGGGCSGPAGTGSGQDITLATINAGTAQVRIRTEDGGIFDANGAGTLNVTADSVVLRSEQGVDLDTAVNTLMVRNALNGGAGDVVVRNTSGSGTLNLQNTFFGGSESVRNANGNIDITETVGSINVVGNVDSGTAQTTLTAGNEIFQSGGTVVAGDLILTAVNGIGRGGNVLQTDATNLKATNTNNGIEITNANALTLTNFGTGDAIANPNGAALITVNNGNLTVNSPVVAGRKFGFSVNNGDLAINADISGTGAGGGSSFLNASGAVDQATGTTIQTSGGSAPNRLISIISNFLGGAASGVTQNGTAQINTNGGDLSVQDFGSGSITLTGASTAGTGTGNLTATAIAGGITLSGTVTTGATGGTITLNGLGGNVAGPTATVITTGTLTGNAAGAVDLSGANEIGTLGSFTSSGGFALNDTTGGLILSSSFNDATGLVDIATNGGALTMNANTITGVGVNLTAAGTTGSIAVDGAVNGGASPVNITVGQNVTTSAAISGSSVNTLFGQATAGAFTANGGSVFTGATTVTGGGSGNTFSVNTPITANLMGGAGSDTFTLASALTGSVDGGGLVPTDTLQGAALSNPTLTGTGPAHGFAGNITGVSAGFQNIDTLAATGTLTGANVATTWTGNLNTGATLTSGANTLNVSGFTNAVGGTAADTFTNVTAAGTLSDPGGTTTTNGTIQTGGLQTYTGSVTLGTSSNFVSTGGGTISFGSTIDGTTPGFNNLVMATTGNVVLGTGIGGSVPLAVVTVAGSLPTIYPSTFTDPNNVPPVNNLTMTNITATTSTTGSVVLSANTFSGTGTITTGSLTINGEVSAAPDFSITLAVQGLTVTGPNGSTWRFGGDVGNNSAAVPPGSGIGVFTTVDGFLTLTASQVQGGNIRDQASAAAASAAVGDAADVFGTDSVAQQMEYGFAGDVGTLPPIDHRLQGVGIRVPACFNESREGEECAQ